MDYVYNVYCLIIFQVSETNLNGATFVKESRYVNQYTLFQVYLAQLLVPIARPTGKTYYSITLLTGYNTHA